MGLSTLGKEASGLRYLYKHSVLGQLVGGGEYFPRWVGKRSVDIVSKGVPDMC